MTYFKCPHCDATIDYLKYTSECSEYGRYDFNNEEEEDAQNGDYNCDDSETNNTITECPECDTCTEPEDLIFVNEDEDEDEEEDEEGEEEEEKPTKERIRENSSTIIIPRGYKKYYDTEKPEVTNHVFCPKDKTITLVSNQELEEDKYVRCTTCMTKINIEKLKKQDEDEDN